LAYHFANSNGAKIAYQERGHGQPLLLIMGFGADGNVWEKHTAVYEKYFRCIILDNRGVGTSDQPKGPYTTHMMAEDVVNVMDHAGIQSALVAGISMGGAIAQELTIDFPDRVSALALISTWSKFNNYTNAVYENLKHIRSTTTAQYFAELLQLWIYAPPYYETNWDELKEAALEASENKNLQTRDGFEGQIDACIHHNATARLHHIKAPVLITVGGMDIFTPPAFSQIIHEKIPQSVLSVYHTGGHIHHWEDLERFNNETLDFFLKYK
jgi:pimeloyl-ACP methyl ester carboxylesterase